MCVFGYFNVSLIYTPYIPYICIFRVIFLKLPYKAFVNFYFFGMFLFNSKCNNIFTVQYKFRWYAIVRKQAGNDKTINLNINHGTYRDVNKFLLAPAKCRKLGKIDIYTDTFIHFFFFFYSDCKLLHTETCGICISMLNYASGVSPVIFIFALYTLLCRNCYFKLLPLNCKFRNAFMRSNFDHLVTRMPILLVWIIVMWAAQNGSENCFIVVNCSLNSWTSKWMLNTISYFVWNESSRTICLMFSYQTPNK